MEQGSRDVTLARIEWKTDRGTTEPVPTSTPNQHLRMSHQTRTTKVDHHPFFTLFASQNKTQEFTKPYRCRALETRLERMRVYVVGCVEWTERKRKTRITVIPLDRKRKTDVDNTRSSPTTQPLSSNNNYTTIMHPL